MVYEEGYFILDEQEIKVLAFATMNEIEPRYEAGYFLGAMEEIKASATDEISRIQAQNDRGTREDIIVDLWKLMIQFCDHYAQIGRDAAEAAGASIKLH